VVASCSAALSPFALMVDGSGVASGAGFVDLPCAPADSAVALRAAADHRSCSWCLPIRRNWLRRFNPVALVATVLVLPIAEFLVAPQVQNLWVETAGAGG